MKLIMSNPVFDGSTVHYKLSPAFRYALKLKNLEMAGTQSNPNIKNILIEMFKNYNVIDFNSIRIYQKCA